MGGKNSIMNSISNSVGTSNIDLQFQKFLSEQRLVNKELIEASKNQLSNYKLATGAVCVIGVYLIWVQTAKPTQEKQQIVRRMRAVEYRNGEIIRDIVMDERVNGPLGNLEDEANIWRALPVPRPFDQGLA